MEKSHAKQALRPGELPRVGLCCVAFFLILCSYYILRPVRDEMAVQYGADKVHWLFTGTLILALLAVPAFGWVVKRLPRAWLAPAVYGFLVLNLLLFCLAFSMRLGSVTVAALFFVWLSVFNLFAVSLFWSTVSDCFSTDEAHRLYGYIAAGGTAGALAGPTLTVLLAKQAGTAGLIGLSALLLALATACLVLLRRHRKGDAQEEAHFRQPIGGSILAGISLAVRSPSLRAVALLIVFYSTVSTVLYIQLVDLAGKTYTVSSERKALFATLDLTVNLLSLAMQLLGTRQIVQRYGLRLALPAVPLVMLMGLSLLSFWGTLAGYAIMQVMHRAGEYALGRPGREMIYTTVDAESRYKAKNFIDIAVYRANDAASAWLIALVRSLGWSAVALVGIPAALVWLATAANLGRLHDQLHGSKRNETT